MSHPPRESWLFRVELPAGVEHGGRFMARVLKYLLRAWGVKATAILDAPPDVAAATRQPAQDAAGGASTIGPPADADSRQRAANATEHPS